MPEVYAEILAEIGQNLLQAVVLLYDGLCL